MSRPVPDIGKTKALLRLQAFDLEDLAVLSAHLQDAVVRAEDIAYQRQNRRFVLALARFDWAAAADGCAERCGAGLHFEHVRRVTQIGLAGAQREPSTGEAAPMSLLGMDFEVVTSPAGIITLFFSEQKSIRLEVECLEAQLRDIGPRWSVEAIPGQAPDAEVVPS